MTSVCVHVTCTTPQHSTPALHHSAVMTSVGVHITCTTPQHSAAHLYYIIPLWWRACVYMLPAPHHSAAHLHYIIPLWWRACVYMLPAPHHTTAHLHYIIPLWWWTCVYMLPAPHHTTPQCSTPALAHNCCYTQVQQHLFNSQCSTTTTVRLSTDKEVFPSLVHHCGTRCCSLFVTHLWQWRSSAHIWRLFCFTEHIVLSIAPSWQFRL